MLVSQVLLVYLDHQDCLGHEDLKVSLGHVVLMERVFPVCQVKMVDLVWMVCPEEKEKWDYQVFEVLLVIH